MPLLQAEITLDLSASHLKFTDWAESLRSLAFLGFLIVVLATGVDAQD